MASRNVILACATGYCVNDLLPFVVSAAKCGLECDMVFFRSRHDAPLDFSGHSLGSLNIVTVVHDLASVYQKRHSKRLRDVMNVSMRALRLLPMGMRRSFYRFLPAHQIRLFWYDEYLKAHPEAGKVLLCDCRDAVFQSDPFASVTADEPLIVAEEDYIIENEANNIYWLHRVESAFQLPKDLSNQTVICSGAIIGMRAAILNLVRAMQDASIKAIHLTRTDGGFDQTYANILVRGGDVPQVTVYPTAQPPIVHIGAQWRDKFVLDAQRGLLTKAGELIPVVHQYDRRYALIEFFSHRLGVACTPFAAFCEDLPLQLAPASADTK